MNRQGRQDRQEMQKHFMAGKTNLNCHAMIIRPSIFDFVLNPGFLGGFGG
jgi:hypothetical protein